MNRAVLLSLAITAAVAIVASLVAVSEVARSTPSEPPVRDGATTLSPSPAPTSTSTSTPTPASTVPSRRRFVFEYRVDVPAALDVDAPLRLFLPVAPDAIGQRIHSLEVEVDDDFQGRFGTEPVHGNRFWSVTLPARRSATTSIVMRYDVERAVVRAGDERGSAEQARAFLGASRRVVVDHPILQPILAEIRASTDGADAAARARAIYDWVVDNLEYKKIGRGWGNGDTFWACSERYGNCTDFHSLFISLARTEGIPARFQMGFPIPADRDAGRISGYHCWVEFWLPEVGWIPIDASEAVKQPERRALYFGTHPADRMLFSTGRDLALGPDQRAGPLNYFIYPHVEVGGERRDVPVRTTFQYRVIGDDTQLGTRIGFQP